MLKKISYVICLLSIISVFILNFKLISMEILPLKYLSIFVILLIIVVLLFLTVLKIKNIWAILSILILLLIISIGSIFVFFEINKVDKFFNNLSSKEYELTEYYVLVLNNNKYNEVNDLRTQKIGIIPFEEEIFNNVRTNLYELIIFDEINYEDEEKALKALDAKVIQAVLISDSSYEILKDEKIINEDDYKIIHKISLKIEIENIKSDKDITKEAFNIYISGSDKYGSIVNSSRSDVNIIVTINPKTHEVLITSIPRDYYVKVYGTTGYNDKLTHAGNRGIGTSVNTIEDLLDIKIDYYLKVNFTFFIELVDLLDGIEIYSDKEFSSYTIGNCNYYEGKNKVDGWCALGFARERYAYKTGDRHRGENQMHIIEQIIKKISTNKKYLLKYSEIIKSLDGKFATNASSKDIYAMIKYQLSDMPSWEVTSNSLTGSDSREYTYSYKSRKLYVMIPNGKSVSNATKKINEIMNK